MGDPIQLSELNTFQNIAVFEDGDGDGVLSAGDRATAKQDVKLNVLADPNGSAEGPRKEVSYKKGEEIPLNQLKFLTRGYNAKYAKVWREDEKLRIPQEVEAQHGVKLKKIDGNRSALEHFEVFSLKDGTKLGRVAAAQGDGIALHHQVAKLKAQSQGQKIPKGPSQVHVSPEAEKALVAAGFKIEYGENGIEFQHPKHPKAYYNNGSEAQVFIRKAGNRIESFALLKDGGTSVTLIWPHETPKKGAGVITRDPYGGAPSPSENKATKPKSGIIERNPY